MHLGHHILFSAALMTMAPVGAHACPDDTSTPTRPAALTVRMSPSGAALIAWKPRAWVPRQPLGASAGGLRVAIDPVDGSMGMPAADELPSHLAIGDDAPVEIDRAPDGTLTAHLDDRWADFAVATVGPEGKPEWTCVQGRQRAARVMNKPFPPVVPPATKWEDQ